MIKYPDSISANNPNAYHMVNATEVGGHKNVVTKDDLVGIADCKLKNDGDTDAAAEGQLWWVVNEKCFYQLVSYSKRHSTEGWQKYEVLTSTNFQPIPDSTIDSIIAG